MSKPTARIERCPGEAHQPGGSWIDNCMVCLPWWRLVPVCEKGHKLQGSPAGGYCRKCRRYYALPAGDWELVAVDHGASEKGAK